MAILLMACLPAVSAGQTAPASAGRTEKRWSVSGAFAGASREHERSFESAMRAAHFDDPSPGLSGAPIAHPFSGGQAFSELEVIYRWKRRLAFSLLRSPVMLGTTVGYQDPLLYLFVNSKVTVVAPMAYLRFGKHVRVGAGPLVAWTDVHHRGAVDTITYKSVTGGGIVAAAVEGNPLRFLHLAFTASYRRIAPVTVGPFTATFPDTPPATLPAFKADLSHKSVGVSLGFRF